MRARNEIVADRVKFLDRQGQAVSPEAKAGENDIGEFAPEDIPF